MSISRLQTHRGLPSKSVKLGIIQDSKFFLKPQDEAFENVLMNSDPIKRKIVTCPYSVR
jgi:hypothetical protein